MPTNKKIFEVEVDGKKIKLAVTKPDNKIQQEAALVYGRKFHEAVKAGLMVRLKIGEVMLEQGLWDEDKEKRKLALYKSINEGEKKLAKGGINLSEAKAVAVKIRNDRAELRLINANELRLDSQTAEAHAEQERFNHYVASCTVYADNGNRYFKSLEDYLSRSETDAAVRPACDAVSEVIYAVDSDWEKSLPENKFLLKYKLANDDLRLIDRNGNLVDSEGNRVNEEGYRINENDELIDSDGVPLDSDGNYKVEFTDFIDDINKEPAVEVPAENEESPVKPDAEEIKAD